MWNKLTLPMRLNRKLGKVLTWAKVSRLIRLSRLKNKSKRFLAGKAPAQKKLRNLPAKSQQIQLPIKFILPKMKTNLQTAHKKNLTKIKTLKITSYFLKSIPKNTFNFWISYFSAKIEKMPSWSQFLQVLVSWNFTLTEIIQD